MSLYCKRLGVMSLHCSSLEASLASLLLALVDHLSSLSSPVPPHPSWLHLLLHPSPSAGAKGSPDVSFLPHLSHKEGSSLRCLLAWGGNTRVWNSVEAIGTLWWFSTNPEWRRNKFLLNMHRLTRNFSGGSSEAFSAMFTFIAQNNRWSINQRKTNVTCLQWRSRPFTKSSGFPIWKMSIMKIDWRPQKKWMNPIPPKSQAEVEYCRDLTPCCSREKAVGQTET